MKSILVISWAAPPLLFPRAIQVSRLLRSQTQEWCIHLICCAANFSSSALDYELHRTFSESGIRIYPVDPVSPAALPLSQRLHEWGGRPRETNPWISNAWLMAEKILRENHISAVITFAQPWSDHLIGLKLKQRHGLPWIAHFSDPWASNPFNRGQPARARHQMREQEGQVVFAADTLIFVNDETRTLTMSRYPADMAVKAVVLPHAFDPDCVKTLSRPKTKHQRFRICYTGNFYQERNPQILLNALLLWHERENLIGKVEVRFVGAGADNVAHQARLLGLDEVVFRTGVIGYRASLEEMTNADLCLVIDAPFPQSPFLPSKLVDYLGVRVPVLGIVPEDGCSASLLKRAGCRVVPADAPSAVAQALSDIYESWRRDEVLISSDFDRTRHDFSLDSVSRRFDLILRETINRARYGSPVPKQTALEPPPPRVSFVALYCRPLFIPTSPGLFGGTEVRTYLLATELSRQSELDVSVLVFDQGQERKEVIGNSTLIPHVYYPAPGFSSRSYRNRWHYLAHRVLAKLRQLINRKRIDGCNFDRRAFGGIAAAEADIYCALGVNNTSAEVVAYCKLAGKKSVLIAGSDINFSTDYRQFSDQRDSYGVKAHWAWYAITHADVILVQTEHQAQLCQDRFGRSSTVIRNPIDLGQMSAVPRSFDPGAPAIWIGKADRTKRPELLIELATRLPEIPFVMVMNRSNPDVFDAVMAACPPNVTIIEKVTWQEADELIERARVLVNTSAFEGFPNTFLQAGRSGTPIASLNVDPDGFISKFHCGTNAGADMNRLAQSVHTICHEQELWLTYSANIRNYVKTYHDLSAQTQLLRQALETLL